jgi:hypothetical protein
MVIRFVGNSNEGDGVGKHQGVLAMLMMVLLSPFLLVGCGGSADAASFCSDLKAVNKISGTDSASLRKAATLFAKLASETEGSVRADFSLLSADETKVLNGRAASVNNEAAEAASRRIGRYAQKTCGQGT